MNSRRPIQLYTTPVAIIFKNKNGSSAKYPLNAQYLDVFTTIKHAMTYLATDKEPVIVDLSNLPFDPSDAIVGIRAVDKFFAGERWDYDFLSDAIYAALDYLGFDFKPIVQKMEESRDKRFETAHKTSACAACGELSALKVLHSNGHLMDYYRVLCGALDYNSIEMTEWLFEISQDKDWCQYACCAE